MELKKILFATDFSEGSSHALPFAVDLANKYAAALIVVHVVYDLTKTAGWYIPHSSIDEIYRDIEKSARAELEKIYNEEMKDLKEVACVVLKGTPYEEITKFVLETGLI